MKITDIQIDGFGVWHDLQLSNLSTRLTTFHGANEAGKTTLMQFVRSVLYGMSPERRSRYLPPLAGGKPGGALGIIDGESRFQLSRIADRGPEDLGLVSALTDEGRSGGEPLLREALADVDEPTFNNVFAIGLREIQQLGTLDGTQAAEWLFRLTSGVDRVSLYDVIQGLEKTRCELLSKSGENSLILDLQARREGLRGEIRQLAQQNRQWAQWAVRIGELDEEIVQVETKVTAEERQARTLEIAVGLKPNWLKRIKVSERLQAFEGRIELPEDAIARLDEINSKIEEHRRQADILQGQRQQLRDDSEQLGINELLVHRACRVDALGEQRDWLIALDRQMDRLEDEAQQFEKRLAGEQKRLGAALGLANTSTLQVINAEDLEDLQPHIQEIRTSQKQLDLAQRELSALTENERSLKVKIESAIVDGEHHELPMNLPEASDLVAKLRQRLQVEQRLEQARVHESEMEQQGQHLLEDQILPLSTFGWLLSVFVLSALVLGIWLFVPDSPFGGYGGWFVFLGLLASAFCWLFKYVSEDTAADKLDACHRQIDVVARQLQEAEREKDKLEAELPMPDGSVLLRMQAAERHLAELESLLPVETQRKQAGHEVASAESRVQQRQRQLDKTLASWQSKLVPLGFSKDLDPQQLLNITERYSALGDLEVRAEHRREEAGKRRREFDALTRRVHDLAEEVGCQLKTKKETTEQAETLDQLDHLLSERRRQLADVDRRSELHERAKTLKVEEARHRRAIVGWGRRHDALLQVADCDSEQAYRQLASEQEQTDKMRRHRTSIGREITAAMGRHASEEAFAELLSSEAIGQLDQLWEAALGRLDERQEQLKTLAQQRGELKQQQRTLAKDRSLPERKLELSCVEKQLADARRSWRAHATVSRVLERVRADYETNRQPETLEEASTHLAKMTDGRYRRVWTPLAKDILLVENSAGDSLPVEVLSRGTREQLFLSIRMAVVATFGRRGVKLPMVLDDVLVNFDEHRARRAAEVLCQFAADGHQLLIFTCHEQMWQMFQKLDADCRRLPNRLVDAPALPEPVVEVVAEPVVEEKIVEPKPAPKPRRPKRVEKVRVVERTEEPEEVAAPIAVYEYPFVEKLETTVVQQPAEKTAVAVVANDWGDDLEGQEYGFFDPAPEAAQGEARSHTGHGNALLRRSAS